MSLIKFEGKRMYIKNILAILLVSISFISIAAKPTDEAVLKQVTRANMQDVKLSKTGGSYSTYNLQHWWTRGVTYRISAGIKEFPNATIKIGAEARYRIIGENYDFDKLKTAWNEYEGIPVPTDREILALINKDIIKFVKPYNWNQMVSEVDGPFLSKDPAIRKIEWHTANSFTIHLQAKFSVISSYTEVQDKQVDYAVRFYRDDVKKPWKDNFYSSKSKADILATHKYTSDEIKAMPTQASLAAEKQAKSAMAGLPSIDIPHFSNDKDAFVFIYNILRTGDKKQVEAMFRAMVSSGYLVEGSKTRLNRQGQEMLDKLIANVFDGKITFAESYCPQIFVKSYQPNALQIVDALKKNKSRITLTMSGGRYERGKKVGQGYKINAIEIWTLRNVDDIAQFKSWPFDELCADTAKTFQQLGSSATARSAKVSTGSQSNQRSTTSIVEPPKSWSWSNYQSKYLPVSMQVIGQASEQQKMANGKLATSMTVVSDEGSFKMVATDYKQSITEAIANPTHIQFAKNFVKSNNALIHKKQVTNLGTGEAQEYLIERGSGNQKLMVKFIIFTHGAVVYQVMYSQYKSKFDKAIANEFIRSIKLK